MSIGLPLSSSVPPSTLPVNSILGAMAQALGIGGSLAPNSTNSPPSNVPGAPGGQTATPSTPQVTTLWSILGLPDLGKTLQDLVINWYNPVGIALGVFLVIAALIIIFKVDIASEIARATTGINLKAVKEGVSK